MDNNDKDEKVILKRSALPGVDMSIVDLELVSTVKVRVTIVKKVMYKIRRQTFIGTRDQLDDLDVIQLGTLKRKYRVMKLVKLDDYGGYIYRIKRIDGEPTIGIDIDNANTLGQKVSIVNRPTFDDLFNYACSMQECIPDPVTVDLCNTDSCNNLGLPIEPVDNRCLTNIVLYAVGAAGRTTYTNCSGERVFVEAYGQQRTPVSTNICIAPNPNYVFTGTEPTITATDQECVDPPPCVELNYRLTYDEVFGCVDSLWEVTMPPSELTTSFSYSYCGGKENAFQSVPASLAPTVYEVCGITVNAGSGTAVNLGHTCGGEPAEERSFTTTDCEGITIDQEVQASGGVFEVCSVEPPVTSGLPPASIEEIGECATTKEYRITGSCCSYTKVVVEWIDELNQPQSYTMFKPKSPEIFNICAVEGSVSFQINFNQAFNPHPNNVPCTTPPCGLSTNPTLELLGDCP